MLSCSCTLFNQKETFQLQNYTVTCCQSLCSSRRNSILLSAAENTTQESKHRNENLPQMSKLQIRNHPLPKMSRHLHSPHKLKPSSNNSQKMPPSLSSSKKVKPARLSRPKTIPLPHCNRKMNPFLNNNNNMLLIHLHLKRVPVHFQIMAKNSNCLQQKIPVPYRRNRDTVYIQNLIQFNQLCLIFFLFTDYYTST